MKKFFVSFILLANLFGAHLGLAHFQEGAFQFKIDSNLTLPPSLFNFDDRTSLDDSTPSLLPCQGIVTSPFGLRQLFGKKLRPHEGIDVAAPIGTPITASAKGRVAFIGHQRGYGLTLILDHGNGLTTLYAHNSKILVKEGDEVKAGQEISKIGMSGRSTGPHVHYEVRKNGEALDPQKFLALQMIDQSVI